METTEISFLFALIVRYNLEGYTNKDETAKAESKVIATDEADRLLGKYGSERIEELNEYIGANEEKSYEYVSSIYNEFIDFGDAESDKRRALEIPEEFRKILKAIPFDILGYPGTEVPDVTE